jgi:hypothetical protein
MGPADETKSARLMAVRERVLAEHRETLAATLDAADAVAADPAVLSDSTVLRRRFRERLAERGVLARYPAVLETAVDAAGLALAANAVPAPPYVVVASRGPLCRATTAAGRLVIAVRAFEPRGRESSIDPDIGRRYDRANGSVDDAIAVELRG